MPELPFPIEELSWEKFKVVQSHMGLSEYDAEIIMTNVLGPRPAAVTPEPWLKSLNFSELTNACTIYACTLCYILIFIYIRIYFFFRWHLGD